MTLTICTVGQQWQGELLHVGVFCEQTLTYTPYGARMSPENTHKLMGFYTEVLTLGWRYT